MQKLKGKEAGRESERLREILGREMREYEGREFFNCMRFLGIISVNKYKLLVLNC